MATQNIPHRISNLNTTTHTAVNTYASLMAASLRLRRMTVLELQAELLNERLVAGLPQDDVIFVNVDGMCDPGSDYTPKAWR